MKGSEVIDLIDTADGLGHDVKICHPFVVKRA